MDDATHRRIEDVRVREAEEGEQIVTPNGIVALQSGQLIVDNEDGLRRVMDADEFEALGFNPIEHEKKSPRRTGNATAAKG